MRMAVLNVYENEIYVEYEKFVDIWKYLKMSCRMLIAWTYRVPDAVRYC